MHPALRICLPLIACSLLSFPSHALASKPEATAKTDAAAKKADAVAKDDAMAEVAQVQKRAAARKDFTVEFRQEVYSALRKKSSESHGSLSFQPPGKFRWELRGAKRELYVSNGKDFWKYDESNKHAQRLPPESASLDFVDVVTKLSRLSELFSIETWKAPQDAPADAAARQFRTPPTETNALLIKLVPKAAGPQESVYLSIDKASGAIIEMRIAFRNGNRTRLVLTNLKEAAVDPKVFEFTPPPGTAVDRI